LYGCSWGRETSRGGRRTWSSSDWVIYLDAFIPKEGLFDIHEYRDLHCDCIPPGKNTSHKAVFDE
jgi:hypothetical protein